MLRKNNKIYPYYDLHCHLLPEMDDGCKSVDESINALKMSIQQGCKGCVCTPHYYNNESIRQFYDRRERSYDQLMAALQQRQEVVPGIVLGAEVAYHNGLVHDEMLPYLTLGVSDYLLLEMPFTNWNMRMLRDVQTIISVFGLTPIIAHLERYLDIVDPEYIEELTHMDVLIQMNCGCVLKDYKKAKTRIEDGLVQILSTDSHNLSSRQPNFQKAAQQLADGGLNDELQDILANNESVFLKAAGY